METKKQKVKILIADASEESRNMLVNHFSKSELAILLAILNGEEINEEVTEGGQ